MTKLVGSIYARIAIAVVVGIMLASVLTSFEQPCTTRIPEEAGSQCTELPKAVMYPDKLISDRRVRTEFLTIFAVGSLIGLTVISILPGRRKKPSLAN